MEAPWMPTFMESPAQLLRQGEGMGISQERHCRLLLLQVISRYFFLLPPRLHSISSFRSYKLPSLGLKSFLLLPLFTCGICKP